MAHLAHKGGAPAQPGQHRQDIAGGAAGVGLKEGVALAAGPAGGKVDEQFAQRGNIKHH